MNPVRRGDAIKFWFNHVADQDGTAINVTLYDVRAVLKNITDSSASDSAGLATITDGSGITVTGPDTNGFYGLTCMFPASANTTAGINLKFDVQLTLSADTTDVFTPLSVIVPIVDDSTKTSP